MKKKKKKKKKTKTKKKKETNAISLLVVGQYASRPSLIDPTIKPSIKMLVFGEHS